MKTPTKKTDLEIKGAKQQYAYEFLKNEIVMNRYLPGEPLVEKDICDKLGGVSRTPVRSALVKLCHEGLVESVPGQGMKVANLPFEDLFEILELRIPIEKTTVQLFIERAGEEERRQLEAIYEVQKEALQKNDLLSAVTADDNFHKLIGAGSGNSLACKQIEKMMDMSRRSAYSTALDKNRVEISLKEHKLVLDAIMENDPNRAALMMVEHLESWWSYILEQKMKKYFIVQKNK